MNDIVLPDDPLTNEILALIAISSLTPREKKGWLTVLPDMSDDDKRELKSNLEEQVAFDTEIGKEAVHDLIQVMQHHS